MANIIKAGNAAGGLAVTPDQTGILELRTGAAAGGTTAVTIDASQNATFAGNSTVAGNSSITGNLTVTGNITGTLTSGLGIGQTWQSFTIGTQRVSGTTYTNNTGKPIIVHIGATSGGAATYNYTITVGGVALYYSAYAYIVGDTVVPVGSTYVVTQGSGALVSWLELR
jgi:hypothetical protein